MKFPLHGFMYNSVWGVFESAMSWAEKSEIGDVSSDIPLQQANARRYY